MDENVARILQMLQDGKVNVQEATTLISAVRGEHAAASEASSASSSEGKSGKRDQDNGWRQGNPVPMWVWFWLLCCGPRRCRR